MCLVSPLKPPNPQEYPGYKYNLISRFHPHDNEIFGKVSTFIKDVLSISTCEGDWPKIDDKTIFI